MLNFFFVCDNRLGPIYDWTNKPMNGDGLAYERLEKTASIRKDSYILKGLWREIDMLIPVVDGGEIVTEQFIDFLTKNAQNDMLRDSVFQLWKIILEDYEIVLTGPSYDEIPVFMAKGKKVFLENSYVLTEAKELMDWYINLKGFNGIHFHEPEKTIMYKGVNFSISGHYAPMLRELSFMHWEFFRKTAKKLWIKNAKYLQDFQVDVLKNMGKYTFFTVIRQVGKTLLLSWIALRELLKDRQKGKTTTVIFISNELDAWIQVKEYIEQLSVEFNERFWSSWGTFKITGKDVKFTNGKKWDKEVVYWQIRYFSAQGRNPGTGSASDLIIGDEINLRPEKVRNRNRKVIENRPTRFIWATTMYKESDPNHWSNVVLKKWESAVMKRWPINEWILKTYKKYFEWKKLADIDEEVFLDVQLENLWVWLRYSGEDVEILNEKQKALKKEAYKDDEDSFLVERCGVYPDDVKVFSFDHVIKEIPDEDYDNLIVWYDPSWANSNWDDGWFCVGYVKDGILKVVKTPELEDGDFDHQCDQVIAFISQIRVPFMLIIDGSGFWWSIAGQRFDRLAIDAPEVLSSDNYIKLVTSWWDNTNRLWDVHYSSPLKIQVWFLKNALYNEKVIFSNKLEKLFSQMRKYKKVKTPSGKDTWNGGRWDDYVSALLMMVWYFYEVLGMKDEAFDEQAMKMIKKKKKTKMEISDEIQAKLDKKKRIERSLRNRNASADIY